MKFISDDRIHLFVINPQSLTGSEIEIINKNIQENAEFRNYVNELREFYSKRNYESDNVIELYPEKYISGNEILLVAQQETLKPNLKYIGFHASASKLVLTRIFRDYAAGEYQLHLISEEGLKLTSYGVLEISELNKYLIADEKGIIRAKDDSPFEKYNLKLHSPVAIFNLNKSESTGEIEIESLSDDSKIKIEKENISYKIIRRNDLELDAIKIFITDNEMNAIQTDADDELRFQIKKNIKLPAKLIVIEN